ncbi:MAG: 30S ribosome-binding factor RbfA [Bacteroidales bacterium]
MESTRQHKIARLVQKELAEIFLRESRRFQIQGMVTVTKAYVAKDLAVARVYLSIFSTDDHDKILEQIKIHTREIRTIFASKVKSQLRVIPQIDFFIDDSLDYIDNIDRLLKD